MARILVKGIALPAVKYTLTCVCCRAVVEFESSEGTRVPDYRDGDYLWFQCPCCGNSITANIQTPA